MKQIKELFLEGQNATLKMLSIVPNYGLYFKVKTNHQTKAKSPSKDASLVNLSLMSFMHFNVDSAVTSIMRNVQVTLMKELGSLSELLPCSHSPSFDSFIIN